MKYKKEVSSGGIVYKKLRTKNLKLRIEVLWLITQHSQHKGWGFPKGLVENKNKDESIEEAALREVREEGGVTAKIVYKRPFEIKYKYKFEDYLVSKTVYFFLMEYISGNTRNHDWEVSEAKFINEDAIRNTLSFKAEKEVFEKALEMLHT